MRTERVKDGGPIYSQALKWAADLGVSFCVHDSVEEIPRAVLSKMLGDVGYDNKTVHITVDSEVSLHCLHELCHWVVATPAERTMLNWGIDSHEPDPEDPRRWLEAEGAASILNVGILMLWGYGAEASYISVQLDGGLDFPTLEECEELAAWFLEGGRTWKDYLEVFGGLDASVAED